MTKKELSGALTEGQLRVGVTFNPSGNPLVDEIKNASAALIDLVMQSGADPRTNAIAATQIEQAAMWAVKAITKPSN